MKPIFMLVHVVVASVAVLPVTRAQADTRALAEVVPPAADAVMTESTVARISLAEAVRLAWQRTLASRAALGQRQQAEAEKDAAYVPWADAPSLEVTHWSDRWQTDAGQQESEVGLAWPMLMPGQGAARRAHARAGLVQAEAAERLALLQLSHEVQESAWALMALHMELAQSESNLATLSALADDVERRVRAGDLARADALVARSEVLTASIQHADVRQRLAAARSGWQLLTGQEALPGSELASSAPGMVTDAELANHPGLQLANADRERARARAAQARHERRSSPELTLGMRRESAGNAQPDHESLAIGVRLPLAMNARGRSLQIAAQTELELAELGYERLREKLRVDAESARLAVLATTEQFHAAQSRAALLRERAQLINQSFRAGERPLPELLRALAAATDAESSLGRQQAALGLARARLHHALGKTP